jgi:hypothetical protein
MPLQLAVAVEGEIPSGQNEGVHRGCPHRAGFRDHRDVPCAWQAERPPRGESRRAPLRPVGDENRGGVFR